MRALILAGVPALLLAACGKAPDQTVTLTNANNVVLNDAQADYATRGDYEAANDTAGANGSAAGDRAVASEAGDNVVTANAQ